MDATGADVAWGSATGAGSGVAASDAGSETLGSAEVAGFAPTDPGLDPLELLDTLPGCELSAAEPPESADDDFDGPDELDDDDLDELSSDDDFDDDAEPPSVAPAGSADASTPGVARATAAATATVSNLPAYRFTTATYRRRRVLSVRRLDDFAVFGQFYSSRASAQDNT